MSICLKSAEDLIVGEVLNPKRIRQPVEKFNQGRELRGEEGGGFEEGEGRGG